jgi:hypothetical protein
MDDAGDLAVAQSDQRDSGSVAYGSKAKLEGQVVPRSKGQGYSFRALIPVPRQKEQMNSRVARGRGCTDRSANKSLRHVEIPALVMGIDSDVLCSPLNLAGNWPRNLLNELRSPSRIVLMDSCWNLETLLVAKHITEFSTKHD